MTKPRVTFVVQRYGIEVNGGAELHCRWIAELMNDAWDVSVLSTCAQDYMTWRNTYPAGSVSVNGVRVHRFPVESERDVRKFNTISNKLFRTHHPYQDELTLMKTVGPDGSYNEELTWMQAQGPDSPALLAHIENSRDESDIFIFFTYMYATTFLGLQVVSDKSLLVPTAHDEPMIYLSIYKDFFRRPRGFIFNTLEEKEFLVRKFDIDCTYSDTIGVGVQLDLNGRVSRINLPSHYVVYVGRVDESKGCGQLFDFWDRFKRHNSNNLKLVLVGGLKMKIPSRDDVVPLGFISEDNKVAAISRARCLIVPSIYESFSKVLLEAWLCGVPVLVNGRCDVLKGQCRRANGGLWYENYDEFEACLKLLVKDRELAAKIAGSGKRYTQSNFDWSTIKGKYIRLVDKILS